MKPIEFSVPSSFENIVVLLENISKTSFFHLELDPFGKATSKTETYHIFINRMEAKKTDVIGFLKLTKTKKEVTTIKISEPYSARRNNLPATGSPLTRFISLFAQNLISQGITPQSH